MHAHAWFHLSPKRLYSHISTNLFTCISLGLVYSNMPLCKEVILERNIHTLTTDIGLSEILFGPYKYAPLIVLFYTRSRP